MAKFKSDFMAVKLHKGVDKVVAMNQEIESAINGREGYIFRLSEPRIISHPVGGLVLLPEGRYMVRYLGPIPGGTDD